MRNKQIVARNVLYRHVVNQGKKPLKTPQGPQWQKLQP